jgi:Flp pilus assembly protein TadG
MPAITHPLVNIGPGPNQTPADTARDAFGKINNAVQALDGAVDAAGAAAAAAQSTANAAASAASAAQATANAGVSAAAAAQATANTASSNASAALAQIAARLDTITVDAAVVPTGTALPRVPDVLVVINTPPASPYWVVLPGGASRAPAGKPLWVANRAAGTLRVGEDAGAAPAIEVGSGVSALRVSMGDGSFEALAVAGEDVPASQVSGLAPVAVSGAYADLSGRPSLLRTALFRAANNTFVPNATWRAIRFEATEYDDIGISRSDLGRSFTVPDGISRVRFSASLLFQSSAGSAYRAQLSKNAGSVDAPSLFRGVGFWHSHNPVSMTQTAWIPVSPGDVFRCLGWMSHVAGSDVIVANETWLSVEAY